jgi:sigma-E factor negative regulatory protein RseB
MKIIKSILFFHLFFVFNFIFAAEDPWLIINQAAHAAKNLNYEGIFHSQHSNEIKSIKVMHAFYHNEEYTRVIMLDGDRGEVLSEGNNVVVYHSTNDNVIVEKRKKQHLFPAVFPLNLEALKKNYRLSFGPLERIAGRLAQLVVLVPQDEFRYSYHFWFDKETSIPLKMIVSDKQNKAIEQSSFNQITFQKNINLDWFHTNMKKVKKSIDRKEIAQKVLKNRFWVVKNIPPGFSEVDFISHRIPGLNIQSHQLIYSDGLAYVSVFIRPISKGAKPKVGEVTIGSSNICAKYYNGYQIMSIGSVPFKTVKYFSKSINF